MIDVTCPKCRVELEVPTSQAGGRVTCPECEHTFAVPPAVGIKAGRPTGTKAEPPRGPRSSSPRSGGPASRGKRPPRRRDDEAGSGHLGLILGLTGGGILVLALIGVGLYFAFRGKDKPVAQNTAPAIPLTRPGFQTGPGSGPAPVAQTPNGPGGNNPRLNQPGARAPVTQPGLPGVTNPNLPPTKPPEPKSNPGHTSSAPAPSETGGLYEHVLKSTVWLIVPAGGNRFVAGTGSLIDKANRLILTNFHVVESAKEVAVLFPIYEEGQLVQNRQKYVDIARNQPDSVLKAPVVALDNKHDLALVQLPQVPEGVLPLGVADKDVVPGQNVHSLGNPGSGAMLWVYAPGRVRGVSRQHEWRAGGLPGEGVLNLKSDVIMTDSPTNPGDSGGPLVNDQAQLVGVTHGGDPSSRGVSLFINRSEVIRFIENHCLNKGITWDRSDRKLDVIAAGVSEANLPELVKDLRSDDAAKRQSAAQKLGAMGAKAGQAVDELTRLLKDPEKLTRRLAIEALGKIGPEARGAADALVEVLKDPADAGLRRDAAKALGKIGPAVKGQAFPALAAALEDNDREVRLAAAEAMASLGPLESSDLPVVLKVLKGSDPELRARAAHALGQFPGQAKEVIPQLVAAYNAPGADKQLRVAIVTSVGNFGADAMAAQPVLSDALKSGQQDLVRAACQTVAKLGSEAGKLVPDMGSALEKGDSPTRKEVLSALQKLGPAAKEAAPALAKVLAEKDHEVRLVALRVVEALGKDGKAAAPAVIGLFAEESGMSEHLMSILAKMGKEAVADLINGLGNQHPNVRLGCARALGNIGKDARAARPKLYRLAQTDPHPLVREASYQAWQSVGQR